jgi:trans-aconitate methyltransferase
MINKTIRAFDSHAEGYYNRFKDVGLYKSPIDAFITTLRHSAQVLDLACGPCRISRYMHEIREDLQFHCVDISPQMIEIAKQELPSASFEIADIKNFKSEKLFDGVMCSFALPFLNLDEINTLIKSVSDSLNSGATMYVSTMKGSSEGFEKTSFSGDAEVYFIYHEKSNLDAIFNSHGLSVMEYSEQVFPQDHAEDLIDMIYFLKKE